MFVGGGGGEKSWKVLRMGKGSTKRACSSGGPREVWEAAGVLCSCGGWALFNSHRSPPSWQMYGKSKEEREKKKVQGKECIRIS